MTQENHFDIVINRTRAWPELETQLSVRSLLRPAILIK